MRKRSSKSRYHRHQVKVLQSDVMSPRIAWFNFLGMLRLLTKVALAIGLLLGATYGIRQAIEHTFHRNPDFRLKEIMLNPNDVLDEASLVSLLGIDLSANIFDFNTDALELKLLEMPAISSAEVERHLPGTLNFRITTRKPVAWIACPEDGFPAVRQAGSLLVDPEGFPYPCPPGQAASARQLPILQFGHDTEHSIRPGKILDHPQYRHCLRLLKSLVFRYPGNLPVDTISQGNPWSLSMKTIGGTDATFGLGDHERQIDQLELALNHAQRRGFRIATINLIPKRNVPITLAGEDAPPRAIPVIENTVIGTPADQQSEDIRTLLNRN